MSHKTETGRKIGSSLGNKPFVRPGLIENHVLEPKEEAKIVLELHLRNIQADIETARSMIEPYDGDPSPYKGERRVSETEVLEAIKTADRADRGVRSMLIDISKRTDYPHVEDAATVALREPAGQ